MHPFLFLVVASTLACAACAGAMHAQSRGQRGGRAAALALLGFAWWGACQILFHLQPDPEVAAEIARIATPGWIFLGPLCLQIFMSAARAEAPWMRHALGTLTGLSMLLVVVSLSTPWVVDSLQPLSWGGYGIVPGPLFGIATLPNLLGASLGVWIGRRGAARRSDSEDQRRRWISGLILAPVALIGVTDVWLPLRGVPFPNLAPAAFGPLALLLLWMRTRIGHSPLEPSHVANEILEILPDGVALLDARDCIRIANPSLARLCACPPEELEGVAWSGLLRPIEGEPERAELRSATGQSLPVSTSSAELTDPVSGVLGRVVVVRDLREMADLQSRLLLSARLAAVGELAAGIAHEINNPLAFVRSNLSQLEDRWKRLRPVGSEGETLELVQDVDDLIEESIEGVDRAAETVRSVRSFAHAGTALREATDLRPLLDDVLQVASGQLRNRVNVIREFDEDLPPVSCAPQQMRQVFLNLVVNASQAVDDGGTVLVAARSERDAVIVSVADDGCGIPEDLGERIFDPFFTTKPVGEGPGLGLGIAHQIVVAHGGSIEVESAEREGTVFRVRLPAVDSD
jgi:signal transduction histidine kinase